MFLSRNLYFVLALSHSALTSSNHAMPTHAMPTHAMPNHAMPADAIELNAQLLPTIVPRADNSVYFTNAQADDPAQKPLAFCPEDIKRPVHSCSSCGGEDPNVPGQCKDRLAGYSYSYRFCKCGPPL